MTAANPILSRDVPWPARPWPFDDGATYTGAQVRAMLRERDWNHARQLAAWLAEAEAQWATERLGAVPVGILDGEGEGHGASAEADEFLPDGGSDD